VRKLFIILILTLLVTVNVFAEVDSEQIKEAVITVAHVAVEGQYHPYNEGLRVMQEVLDQETSGKIKLKILCWRLTLQQRKRNVNYDQRRIMERQL
jgi:TRAP-type C4-dicarboxylate transport system substrate-binding protein